MKKYLLFFLLLTVRFSNLTAQSTIVDSAALRAKINTDIQPNTTGAINAYKVNNILNGMLNVMQRYKMDSSWISGGHLYYKRFGATYDEGLVAGGTGVSLPYNGDSTYYLAGDTMLHKLSVTITGGDTTILGVVIDSTGQPSQRVLYGVGNNKIGSNSRFLYDSTRTKLVIGNKNISSGGNSVMLWVQGNGAFGGNFTANSIIKKNGLSTQFLKADGSVDPNTYLQSYTETDPVAVAKTITINGNTQALGTNPSFTISTGSVVAGDTSTLNVHTNGYNDLRYEQLANKQTTLDNSTTHYPSTSAVKTEINNDTTLVHGQIAQLVSQQATNTSNIAGNTTAIATKKNNTDSTNAITGYTTLYQNSLNLRLVFDSTISAAGTTLTYSFPKAITSQVLFAPLSDIDTAYYDGSNLVYKFTIAPNGSIRFKAYASGANADTNASNIDVPSILTYASTTDIDFSHDKVQYVTLAGNITFTTSNLSAGREKLIKIIGDGSTRTLTLPAWTFIGDVAPTSIAAGKSAILSLYSFGTTNTNVIASYSVQP